MVKLFRSTFKEGISAAELKRKAGEIKIFDDEGKLMPLSGEKLYKYLQDMFDGGKTLTLAKKEMIRNGIKDQQFQKREKLLKILEQIATGEDESKKAPPPPPPPPINFNNEEEEIYYDKAA